MSTNQHIQHVRSSVSGKIPTADVLEYGEIAVNYADEVIYIKNTNDEVVGIGKSDEVYISNGIEPEKSEIWIDTSETPEPAIEIEDAPEDGNQYVRQDGQWTEVIVPTTTSELTNDSGFITDIDGGTF